MKWFLACLGVGIVVVATCLLKNLTVNEHTLQVWDLTVKTVAGVAIIGGAFKYLYERAHTLRWEKARFMVELSRDFDNSPGTQTAKRLIDQATYDGDESHLIVILSDPQLLSDDLLKERYSIDAFLDFFDRLYSYVFISKNLKKSDVVSFWGYIHQVNQLGSLRDYCYTWGYEDVLRLAEEFAEPAAHREEVIEELETDERPNGQP